LGVLVIRSHALHRDASDERVRLARLARLAREWEEHENAIRERARRRVLATLTVEEPVEDPTGFAPGCVI
jgi:hypothetical protein